MLCWTRYPEFNLSVSEYKYYPHGIIIYFKKHGMFGQMEYQVQCFSSHNILWHYYDVPVADSRCLRGRGKKLKRAPAGCSWMHPKWHPTTFLTTGRGTLENNKSVLFSETAIVPWTHHRKYNSQLGVHQCASSLFITHITQHEISLTITSPEQMDWVHPGLRMKLE